MKNICLIITSLVLASQYSAAEVTSYVDPKIGSEGLGRVYIGPTMPYGMIKPSPDGVSMPNSGWAPMPEAIKGFSQVHVSGTGGGQKYGNILIMPFIGNPDKPWEIADTRAAENIKLGYYSTQLQSGIGVEITAADRAAIYTLTYPKDKEVGLVVDAGAFLGMSGVPDQRETQQFVGSQIEVVSDTEIRGYNRVRGGWNNGRAYTVYFYAQSDVPFTSIKTWKGTQLSNKHDQSDSHQPTGAVLEFAKGTDSVKFKIGISYLSELKARENLENEIPDFNFQAVYAKSLQAWEVLLSRLQIAETTSNEQKRMFYTSLYHTMIMPTDRNGENPLWADDDTYYDDYYAIWDTYRTSTPMITLLDPEREVSIVNSLLNIYRRDGYMPDARSGNSNGRTQGGSNAEIVIADAYVKGLQGIDYQLALEAMLKDADMPPGGIEEAEGRGGLVEYNTIGYVPFGIPRAGNRTVEYSYCDYAIAQVAKGLGHNDIYDRFMRQSGNWRNLWRDDYEHAGTKGFIMPRDKDGVWLDSLPQGHSEIYQPKYEYTAMTFEGPWYTPWWSMFFYEAPSWEYSLSIPHDVQGLIEKCGGAEKFEQRLDTFFDSGFYNVNNEPSFLSPCLYHWIGKPYRSSERVHQIIKDNYNDTPMGLPGNDDSGAMSSWLAFHMIGLYPNAGQDYYLINSPMVESATFHLANGKDFTIKAENFSEKASYIQCATLKGKDYPYSSLRHADIIAGGELVLRMGSKPSNWGAELAPEKEVVNVHCRATTEQPRKTRSADLSNLKWGEPMRFTFKLHGQTRRYQMSFQPTEDGGVILTWGIERNLKWQEGTMTITAEALLHGNILSYLMPIDGEHITLPTNTTAYMLSRDTYLALVNDGKATINNAIFEVVDNDGVTIHIRDNHEGCEMWILARKDMPIVIEVSNNPLEADYTVAPL